MSAFFDARKDSALLRSATQAFSDRLLEELMPSLRLAARGLGYALAVHGTRARDIDIIAIPWTANASDHDELLSAILGALASSLGNAHVHTKKIGRNRVRDWSANKPHGRRAILIYLPGLAPEIDFQVMPRLPKETSA